MIYRKTEVTRTVEEESSRKSLGVEADYLGKARLRRRVGDELENRMKYPEIPRKITGADELLSRRNTKIVEKEIET